MYRWFGCAFRHAKHASAGCPCKSFSRILLSVQPTWIPFQASEIIMMHSSLPFSIPQMQYATRSRAGPPAETINNEIDDEEDDSDEEDEDDDVDDSEYQWDYETWNLLHQGKKPGEKSRKQPLPMYKAREMVDFHMIKNRIDGLQVITDPKLEEDLKRSCHENLVDFLRRTQAAFDEIDAEQNKGKEKLDGTHDKETLKLPTNKTESQEAENMLSIEGNVPGDELKPAPEESEAQVDVETKTALTDGVEAGDQLQIVSEEGEAQLDAGTKAADSMSGEGPNEDSESLLVKEHTDVEADLASLGAVLEDIAKEDHPSAEPVNEDADKGGIHVIEVTSEEAGDDGVNVFDYDKWTAFREEEIHKELAKKAEEQKYCPTLRWKTQLVLGPGDAYHPANRKATVSVYVRELGLSKYAKLRLLSLVGKRYKAPKDELTIVSERFQHRYENQKDVLRTLLDLIEEAKKADDLVHEAKMEFTKAKEPSVDPKSKSTENLQSSM